MPVSRRLARKIEKDFPADWEAVISMLHEMERESFGGDAGERLLAAVILVSRGDIDRVVMALEFMAEDWRDLLMDAGLESEDWASRLDEFFLGRELT
ncbi:hypothetical protein NGF19_17730 [Streptomyces sp. RY43-2]|uniref:Uncharacterized protein n=1 Tax=Streptomyces macrolidinus TaxID=2952607 RepID=A0ABT0ZG95_9ACTN|nr:hypothetical protein [Streptomyces macrolidinus]MCN9242613.1 hypothetical protein [Streptomyces macrolidinus]